MTTSKESEQVQVKASKKSTTTELMQFTSYVMFGFLDSSNGLIFEYIYPIRILLKCLTIFILIYQLNKISASIVPRSIELIQFGLIFGLLSDIAYIFTKIKSSSSIQITFFTMAASKIFYLLAYCTHINETSQLKKDKNVLIRLMISLPFLIFGLFLSMNVTNRFGTYKILVMLYIFLMSFMGMAASWRYGKTTNISFWMIQSGSIFLILSSIIIGAQEMKGVKVIMITIIGQLLYYWGNYLLTYGIINHIKNNERFDMHYKIN